MQSVVLPNTFVMKLQTDAGPQMPLWSNQIELFRQLTETLAAVNSSTHVNCNRNILYSVGTRCWQSQSAMFATWSGLDVSETTVCTDLWSQRANQSDTAWSSRLPLGGWKILWGNMKQQGPGNGTEGGRNPIHKQTRLFTTVQLGEEIISYHSRYFWFVTFWNTFACRV